MPLSRDHHRSRAATAGGVAAASYPVHAWKHRNRYDAPGDDDLVSSAKRRKPAVLSWEDVWKWHKNADPSGRTFVKPLPVVHCDYSGIVSVSAHRKSEEDDVSVMSRDDIDRCSPSRKDGINRYTETHLRYSYCAYLQCLGMRLDLPHSTVGTAMVLCHRFFLRRSHASHDRFLIATTALFLAAKSEETPCQLNSVLCASYEICQKQNFAFFPQLCTNWSEVSRDRVIEAEQLILTTLNFELEVEHPYVPLTSVFNKLGLSQTVLLNLAWNLLNEGLRSSLWLQFKPNHIAAGAACLAAKFLNFDLTLYQQIWQEFHTTAPVLEDVVQQLMELL